ncbi:MAG: hypothetical protein D3923_01775 [Candidatus Electrothrix sp. AR3]|nr:hypothetical protein [Candidatus Electrothrix sp. AR3]
METRCAALGGLACDQDELDWRLLTHDLSGYDLNEDDQDQYIRWLDPQAPITAARITQAAKKLGKPVEEIAQRYAVLAKRFDLQLEAKI